MIRIPRPLRDKILEVGTAAFIAAFDELVEATDADSDGGRKITRSEAKAIARKAYTAARDAFRPHEVPDPPEGT